MAQGVSRSLSRGVKTSRLSRRSQAVVLRRSLSDASSRSVRFVAQCLAAVVSGALRERLNVRAEVLIGAGAQI